ncbi:hypothetical protein GCK32_005882 [Trichostrongylus colubriformis]|uniref:Peptidase M13 N-terminal domain-containing protein n=1 Tax=Trichostrongylus colubriformis TaxID=6319 RepID=A0AAN8F0M6_TRICO
MLLYIHLIFMHTHERILSMLLILHECFGDVLGFCDNGTYDDSVNTYQLLADYIKFSVDYKVDPCEDFYQFACGNWKRNTKEEPPYGGEISSLQKLDQNFEEQQKKLLRSKTKSDSKAIQLARDFYQKCVSAEEAWNSTKTSGIIYVMEKIKEFGVFPMLSEDTVDEAKLNASFDLMWLLAYFNQNRTVLHRIAPRIVRDRYMDKAEISFYPSRDVFSFLAEPYAGKLKEQFTEFLLSLMKLIAEDIGVNYHETFAPPHILELQKFMEKLHAIPVPNLELLLPNDNYFDYESDFRNLSKVDRTTYSVNWTEYFLLVAPEEVHDYILEDPEVLVPDDRYIERFNKVLSEASPKTITNYVMVQYILSWLPLLEERYSRLVQMFAANAGETVPTARDDLCFFEAKEHFELAITSMYARSASKKVPKSLIENMVIGILKEFKGQIEESKWMDNEFKEVVLLKLHKLRWKLLDDELFYNNAALDAHYSDYAGMENLSFLHAEEWLTHKNKIQSFIRLIEIRDAKAEFENFSVMGYRANAYYYRPSNMINMYVCVISQTGRSRGSLHALYWLSSEKLNPIWDSPWRCRFSQKGISH